MSGVDDEPHMIGANELALMKPTSVIVNTSRGPVIDEVALTKVLADHRKILRKAVRDHVGEEVDNQGDSFLFAFSRADQAAGAAIDAQQALAPLGPEPDDARLLRVRVDVDRAGHVAGAA